MRDTEAVYVFRSFRVDSARRLLLRGGRSLSVTAKVFDLLIVLIRSRARVVTRAELMEQLWPDTTVEDGNLSVTISALRQALGSGPDDAPIIETLPRVGYRLSLTCASIAGRWGARRLAVRGFAVARGAGNSRWFGDVERARDVRRPLVQLTPRLSDLLAEWGE